VSTAAVEPLPPHAASEIAAATVTAAVNSFVFMRVIFFIGNYLFLKSSCDTVAVQRGSSPSIRWIYIVLTFELATSSRAAIGTVDLAAVDDLAEREVGVPAPGAEVHAIAADKLDRHESTPL
jgi:hypothetical protein